MRVTLAVVGRPKNKALAAAIADYEKRAGRYWQLDVREIREERGSDALVVRRREGDRLLAQLDKKAYVACDADGKMLVSREFATMLGESRDSGQDIAFVIGGAFGLDERVRKGAKFRLALAPWTLPHELARLVLVEQLYRAGTILRGEPYHK